MRPALAVALTLVASGCSGRTVGDSTTAFCPISASNYDQSCAGDGDCVIVYTGNVCGAGCFCPNSTISASVL